VLNDTDYEMEQQCF